MSYAVVSALVNRTFRISVKVSPTGAGFCGSGCQCVVAFMGEGGETSFFGATTGVVTGGGSTIQHGLAHRQPMNSTCLFLGIQRQIHHLHSTLVPLNDT